MIKARTIASIIKDMVTTGATIEEVEQAIKEYGSHIIDEIGGETYTQTNYEGAPILAIDWEDIQKTKEKL
jgi:hypothetical protein